MSVFPPDFLLRLDCLSLAIGRPAGVWQSGLRDYVPGDDYRHIDWPLCARRDELQTRVFQGDEDSHSYILLDCSPSMGLGNPAKFQLARQVAASLGHVALARGQRVGVTAFAAGIVGMLPPVRGRTRSPRLLAFLDQLAPGGVETDLARSAEGFVRQRQRRGPAVVISDLYDRRGFQRGLDILRSHGYPVRVVQIQDPADAESPPQGDVELLDVESGNVRRATITEQTAARYRAILARFHASVREYCARRGVACVQMACDANENEVLRTVREHLATRPSFPRKIAGG